tara:strand:+ start:15897 stop:16280 length:384 start_codon:yes stop_codon:yes gene_type:complete
VLFEDSQEGFENLIAKAANLSNKPFIHSVITVNGDYILNSEDIDLTINILCRDIDGKRLELFDLELEIYKSNNDLVLVITKLRFPNEPMLWSGPKDIWMDGNTGKKCKPPDYAFNIENLASRIKSIF